MNPIEQMHRDAARTAIEWTTPRELVQECDVVGLAQHLANTFPSLETIADRAWEKALKFQDYKVLISGRMTEQQFKQLILDCAGEKKG